MSSISRTKVAFSSSRRERDRERDGVISPCCKKHFVVRPEIVVLGDSSSAQHPFKNSAFTYVAPTTWRLIDTSEQTFPSAESAQNPEVVSTSLAGAPGLMPLQYIFLHGTVNRTPSVHPSLAPLPVLFDGSAGV